MHIDLNADLGESPERWATGEDPQLLGVVTSANVACGGYAGDADLMRSTCLRAVRAGVSIGAQVGYPDRDGFGRRFLDMPPDSLQLEVVNQIETLRQIAGLVGATVSYVKPHGALYNTIVHHEEQAAAVVDAIAASGGLPLVGLPGSLALEMADSVGIRTVHEGFADRAYTPDGTLVPRTETGAVLTEPGEVAEQARRLLEAGVETICVHSDSPGALGLARTVREALEDEGATLRRFVI